MKKNKEKCSRTEKEYSEFIDFIHSGIHHFCPIIIHCNTKHRHKCLRRFLIDWTTTLNIRLTRGNVSNCLRFLIKQNNCILIDEVISSKHIVKRIKLPSFFPGPKIYIKQKFRKNNFEGLKMIYFIEKIFE
jgi:hypothetical protein